MATESDCSGDRWKINVGTEGEIRYEGPQNLAENVRPTAGGNGNLFTVLPPTEWLGNIGILRKGNMEEIYRIN